MTAKSIKVLELNNVEAFGKHFNGYSIAEYANRHPELNIEVSMLVNNLIESSPFVFPLFRSKALRKCDMRIETLEASLGTKNQISISENALIHNPLYKEADILHFHMYHNMHLPIEFLNRIPPDKRIILDLHDTFWLTDNHIPMLEVFKYSNLNSTNLNAQRKRILNNLDATFIIHSPYMLKLFKHSTVTKSLHPTLISFGTNLNIFCPSDNTARLRAKYKIPPENIVLMFRAQKEFKGLDYIIKALELIKTSEKITLLTVGEKNLCDELKGKYRILNLGYITDEHKMAELYNVCDIFLAPSTEESFGFMVIEAMACGKPIIVFNGTALPVTCNAPNIGISVSQNSKALATAIEHLITHKTERITRGKAGHEFAKKHYNETDYIQNNINMYKSIANSPTKYPCKRKAPPKTHPIYPDFNKINEVATGNQPSSILNPTEINYNNFYIQESLKDFNTKLYKECLKTQPKYTMRNIAKTIIPHKIRKIITLLRRKK